MRPGGPREPSAAGSLWLAGWQVLLLLSPVATPGLVLAAETAELTIRVAEDLGPVNRKVLGHNVEAADSQFIFTSEPNPVPGQTGDGLWDPREPPGQPVTETVRVGRELGMGVLRYPGGCLVHNFDWKRAVGPLQARPDFTFGVDEFLTYCRAVGAEPLITVSAYVGGPAEAAELVEYLNAEASEDHPWARLRADGGHPEPWGVRYFEMGNESDHGNHDVVPHRRLTSEEYGSWVNACSEAMRAVDPDIELGVLMGTGTGPHDPWNRDVLIATRETADFVVVHTYAVGYWGQGGLEGERLMRACMAAGEQMDAVLAQYRSVILEHAGTAKPLAITEYNGGFVQEQPVPYRFTLGAALFAADWIRVLLAPTSTCLMANYWHFVNGYWGLLQGPRVPGESGEPWTEMAACPLLRLWGSHLGERLVAVDVTGPRLEFEGAAGIGPATDPPLPEGQVDASWLAASGTGAGWSWQVTGERSMQLDLAGFSGEAYPVFATAEVDGGRAYTLGFEARLVGTLPDGASLGLGLVDSRGWEATLSGCGADGIGRHDGWTRLQCSVVSLTDADRLIALWRLVAPDQPVHAVAEVRQVSLEVAATSPAYQAVTATASLSGDRRLLHLVVFNKHHQEPIEAQVSWDGFRAAGVRRWEVGGPSLEATNLQAPLVSETASGLPVVTATASGLVHTLPPHSMTAFEIRAEEIRRPAGRLKP